MMLYAVVEIIFWLVNNERSPFLLEEDRKDRRASLSGGNLSNTTKADAPCPTFNSILRSSSSNTLTKKLNSEVRKKASIRLASRSTRTRKPFSKIDASSDSSS